MWHENQLWDKVKIPRVGICLESAVGVAIPTTLFVIDARSFAADASLLIP